MSYLLCAQCDAENPPLQCVKCKCVAYCNKDCQKAHWDLCHQQHCRSCHPADPFFFEGLEKDLIMEQGNGMGGGMFVRQGYPICSAYALASRVSRADFMKALGEAEGQLSMHWTRYMTEGERKELGIVYDAASDPLRFK